MTTATSPCQTQFELHQIVPRRMGGAGIDALPYREGAVRPTQSVLPIAFDGTLWVCVDEATNQLRCARRDETAIAAFRVVPRLLNPVLAMVVRDGVVLVDSIPALPLTILTVKSSLVFGTGCRCFVTKRITPHVGPPSAELLVQKLKCAFCGIPISSQPDPSTGLVTRVITHECGAVYHFETADSHPGVPASDLLSCRDKVRNCLVCQRPVSTDAYLVWAPGADSRLVRV